MERRNKMYKALFLNIDDTIFDYDKCSRSALEYSCAFCNIPCSDRSLEKYREVAAVFLMAFCYIFFK